MILIQHNKKQSFMSKLKTIKIDAPEDFANNIDLYISGEKRVEQDVHHLNVSIRDRLPS